MKKELYYKKALILFLIIIISINIISSQELKVTSEHPFLVNGKWISANQLKIGDKLTTIDGKTARITSIKEVISQNSFDVYNLEANPFNDFIVNEGIVVHNSNTPDPKIGIKEFLEWAKNRQIYPIKDKYIIFDENIFTRVQPEGTRVSIYTVEKYRAEEACIKLKVEKSGTYIELSIKNPVLAAEYLKQEITRLKKIQLGEVVAQDENLVYTLGVGKYFPDSGIDCPGTKARIFSADTHIKNGKFFFFDEPCDCELMWVITEDGEFNFGYRSSNVPFIYHSVLGKGKNVYGSGTVRLIAGEVKYVDGISGHYYDTRNYGEWNRNSIDAFIKFAQLKGLRFRSDFIANY